MAEKNEREEKIRELEEKIKRLEEQQGKSKGGGAAGGVLRGLGDFIPGLSKMLEGLEDSEAFQERLDAINKEVDKKFRETPLKRAEGGGIGVGLGGIPKKGSIPKVERDFSIETLASERSTDKKQARKPRPKEEKVEKEVLVDIFEEKELLKIIAELPGVEEKDIRVELKEASITISADTPYRKYYKEVALPCPVKGIPEKSYKNGVLEVRIKK